MTYSDDETLDSLKYRLLSPNPALTDWGHEYVRHLSSELGIAYNNRTEAYPPEPTDDLLDLAKQIIPFLLSHNAEPDAVDLLSELDSISLLPEYVDENTWERVVAYVVACVPLLTQDEDRDFLICARTIYRKYGRLVEAMTLSIRLDDLDMIQEDFYTSDDTYPPPLIASLFRVLTFEGR
jgi:26S proteasome regulatory subunit N1